MKPLTVGSCFSGIGGLELGLKWTGGFETRWQIEKDPYAQAVLKKHWGNDSGI
jgi:DNA (cytosine-5)-methyltransferase 1